MAQGQRLGSDVDRKAPQDRLLGAVRDQQGAESEDRTELEAGPELSAETTGAACSVGHTFHFSTHIKSLYPARLAQPPFQIWNKEFV